MSTGFTPSSRVRMAFALLLVLVLAVSMVDARPTAAQSVTPPDLHPHSAIETELPGDGVGVLAVDQRRTLTTAILNADFQEEGVEIAVQVIAKNLRGVPIRAAVFFLTTKNKLFAAAEDTPEEFTTADGALTAQAVFKPRFTNTKWEYAFFVPYEYFPRFRSKTKAYIIAASGVDGDKFVSVSEKSPFTVNPS